MKKEDAILLMCHEVCENLHIDKVIRKDFFTYFYSWKFESYNIVERKVAEIDKSQHFFDKWKNSSIVIFFIILSTQIKDLYKIKPNTTIGSK